MNEEPLIHLPELISTQLGGSRSEARRILAQGGVKIDGEVVGLDDVPLASLRGKTITLGKRQEFRVD